MAQTLDDRLDEAINKRNQIAANKQRIEGRLEAARKSRDEVEAECREKGVDPKKLNKTIKQLEDRYRASVEDLEAKVATAGEAINPFLKES
jgi:chromosome segregation ATPase